jgi:Zn finger protein HypA/HybF involved in hydrogenase expression
MGIEVECPNGHTFKVKDKYAGKKGLCPYCEGEVFVLVPDALTSMEKNKNLREEIIRGHKPKGAESMSSSVLDDQQGNEGSSGRLLGSSVIRHQIRCIKCGESVPMWFARCPACGEYMDHL